MIRVSAFLENITTFQGLGSASYASSPPSLAHPQQLSKVPLLGAQQKYKLLKTALGNTTVEKIKQAIQGKETEAHQMLLWQLKH